MSESYTNDQGSLWEVFIQETGNVPHTHAGSIRANDSEMALQNARDVFARRGKIISMWVVKSDEIVSTSPDDADSFFGQVPDKVYRHPQFYRHTLDDDIRKKS